MDACRFEIALSRNPPSLSGRSSPPQRSSIVESAPAAAAKQPSAAKAEDSSDEQSTLSEKFADYMVMEHES